VVMVLGFFYL